MTVSTKGYERQARMLRDQIMLARMGVALGSKGLTWFMQNEKEVPVEGVCVCVCVCVSMQEQTAKGNMCKIRR